LNTPAPAAGSYTGYVPKPTPETAPFWQGCRDGKLVMPRCKSCGSWIWFPRPFCPACESWDIEWQGAATGGAVHSFTIVHRPAPGWEARAPYVLAVVEMDAGPRISAVLDMGVAPTPENVRVGMRVRMDFEVMTPEVTFPMFHPEAA